MVQVTNLGVSVQRCPSSHTKLVWKLEWSLTLNLSRGLSRVPYVLLCAAVG